MALSMLDAAITDVHPPAFAEHLAAVGGRFAAATAG
jgi:hypothetical protein